MAARLVVAMAGERQQTEPFLGLRHLVAVAEQALVLGRRLAARQQVGARQSRIRIGDGLLRKIALRHGPAGKRGGLEVSFREMALGLRLHLGRRLAERIAIGRVLVDALAQVVEQHAQLAGVFAGPPPADATRAQSRSGRGGGEPTVM